MKNVSVVKGKKEEDCLLKRKPKKLIKNIPEVNKKGERVPFRDFSIYSKYKIKKFV